MPASMHHCRGCGIGPASSLIEQMPPGAGLQLMQGCPPREAKTSYVWSVLAVIRANQIFRQLCQQPLPNATRRAPALLIGPEICAKIMTGPSRTIPPDILMAGSCSPKSIAQAEPDHTK